MEISGQIVGETVSREMKTLNKKAILDSLVDYLDQISDNTDPLIEQPSNA